MMSPPAPLSLTPYETVLQALLAPLSPVPPREFALDAAEGLIAAGTRAQTALPEQDLARADGYAVGALTLIGASALSPVPLSPLPPLVACADPLPPGTDAVLRADLVERRGPFAMALGEALPGEDVLRRGDWLTEGGWIASPGTRIGGAELIMAEAAGLSTLGCRMPKVALLDVSGAPGPSARAVMRALRAMGAEVRIETTGPLSQAASRADLLLILGGTGRGASDKTAAHIVAEGRLIAHGIGFSAAPTLAVGFIDGVPLIALPGAPEAAMAGMFALVFPVLSALSGRKTPVTLTLPLSRKVVSAVGQAEILLLACDGERWHPFPTGPLSPEAWRRASGWCMVGAGDEGWPQGSLLAAEPLERGLPR